MRTFARRVSTIVVGLAIVLATQLALTRPALAADGFIATMDYCGWIWNDQGSGHNGVDWWTTDPDTTSGTGFNGSTKGYPVVSAADGYLKNFYAFPGTSTLYGVRFYHPQVDRSTFYWHMADYNGNSWVESATLAVGGWYPAGTFLGYQGNRAENGSRVVHLHFTVAVGDVASEGGNEIDPSAFLGGDWNGNDGTRCYGAQNSQYRGPHPESFHPYSDFGARWYVILNANTSAGVTRAEFCDLRMNSGDYVHVYQFNTSNQTLSLLNSYTGHPSLPVLSSAGAGRVLFIQLAPNGNGFNDHGFNVCNYHPF